MPRYLIRLVKGETLMAEPVERDFADCKAALEAAHDTAREVVAEKVLQGDVVDAETVEVFDESGAFIGSVTLRDCFRIA